MKYAKLKSLAAAGKYFSNVEITGECLAGSCGNSGLPSRVLATLPAAHVNNFIAVQAIFEMDYEPSIEDAVNTWLSKVVELHGEEVRMEQVSGVCDRSLDEDARKIFAAIPINAIRFGNFQSPSDLCTENTSPET